MSWWKRASWVLRSARPLTEKGVLPSSSSKNRTPKPQTSAFSSWPFFITISGAMYSGVPQTVSLPTLSRWFAEPKSASFTVSPTKSTFSGLMSRCTIPRSCRYASARSSWSATCVSRPYVRGF